MIWICPTRIERPGGALPRLRGRGQQGATVTDAIGFSTLFIASMEDPRRDPIFGARHPRVSGGASRSVADRAQHSAPQYGRIAPCSSRLRKRGSAPQLRLQSAFSLVEVLASLFILTLAAVGITAAWRLADYQELLTRADRRAERILREYYELQTFAPPDSRPFVVNASPSPSPVTGYLYHPRTISSQRGSAQFGNLIPFSISMTNGTEPGTSQLVLTYTIPSYGTQGSRQVTKTVVLNP